MVQWNRQYHPRAFQWNELIEFIRWRTSTNWLRMRTKTLARVLSLTPRAQECWPCSCIIRLIIDIIVHEYALHIVYGWSIHLLGALWSSVANLLYISLLYIFGGGRRPPRTHGSNCWSETRQGRAKIHIDSCDSKGTNKQGIGNQRIHL